MRRQNALTLIVEIVHKSADVDDVQSLITKYFAPIFWLKIFLTQDIIIIIINSLYSHISVWTDRAHNGIYNKKTPHFEYFAN